MIFYFSTLPLSMTKIRVTKEFSFDCAHALTNYSGLCRNIHGHTYKLFVTVIGSIVSNTNENDYGMIIDFSVLKEIVNREIVSKYDHALIASKDSPFPQGVIEYQDNGKYIEFDGRTTCENMAVHFAGVIKKHLPVSVDLFSIKLYETPTSFAEWYASDNL